MKTKGIWIKYAKKISVQGFMLKKFISSTGKKIAQIWIISDPKVWDTQRDRNKTWKNISSLRFTLKTESRQRFKYWVKNDPRIKLGAKMVWVIFAPFFIDPLIGFPNSAFFNCFNF